MQIDKLQEAVEVLKTIQGDFTEEVYELDKTIYTTPAVMSSEKNYKKAFDLLLSLAQQVIDRQGKMPKKSNEECAMKNFNPQNKCNCSICVRDRAIDDCSLALGQDKIDEGEILNAIKIHMDFREKYKLPRNDNDLMVAIAEYINKCR